MPTEALYRAAIIALRNRQWEQATRNLLAVVNADPQHEDAARVLMDLERLRPISYWRGAFMFAIERNEWADAEAAAARLQELESAQPDGSDVTTRLHELTALDWYQPQPPVEPPSSPDAPPPAPESSPETEPDDDPPPGGGAPPAGPVDEAGDWHPPDSASDASGEGWQPPKDPLLTLPPLDDSESSNEDTGEIVIPRALKAAEFSEGRDEIERDNPRGPIYDTLSTPRALKTASFLDNLPRESPAATQPVPPTKPIPTRATPTLAPSAREVSAPPSGDEPRTSQRPVTAAGTPPSPPAQPARDDRPPWSSRPRSRLTVAAFVALLITLLVVIARLARSSTPAIPASPSPVATPTETVDSAVSEIPALIASLDQTLIPEKEVVQASAAPHQARSVVCIVADCPDVWRRFQIRSSAQSGV